MERFQQLVNNILPYIVLILLFLFTLLIVSNVYGIFKAKKVDPTLRLSLNTLGKVAMGLLYGGYLLLLVYTIATEISIITSTEIPSADKVIVALNGLNALTVVSFVAALEFQDIFFIGEKNIFIGNRLYEIRRMRKMMFPKKNTLMFVYGQKEYDFSTRFVDMPTLKSKINRR